MLKQIYAVYYSNMMHGRLPMKATSSVNNLLSSYN